MAKNLKPAKPNPLAGRIKKVMQTDEDVGKIAQGAPVLMVRAMELFLTTLCEGTASIAVLSQARTATPSHLKAYITSNSKLDFLLDKVATISDVLEEDNLTNKRQRSDRNLANSPSGLQTSTSPGSAKAGRGRGRGRARGRGSVRITAGSSQLAQSQPEPKAEQTSDSAKEMQAEAAQPQSKLHPKPDADIKLENEAVDLAVPMTSGNAEGTAAEIQTTEQQNAEQSQQAPPAPQARQQQGVSSHSIDNTHHAITSLPANQAEMLVEEDDYDADN